MDMIENAGIAGKLVRANAVFSGTSGGLLLAGAWFWDEALGVGSWLLALVGIGLIGYALQLWIGSRVAATSTARVAAAMDAAWVIGAAVLLIGFPGALTDSGRLALAAVSSIVLLFAIAQAAAVRRSVAR